MRDGVMLTHDVSWQGAPLSTPGRLPCPSRYPSPFHMHSHAPPAPVSINGLLVCFVCRVPLVRVPSSLPGSSV
eukprot:1825661-Prymnesium_polylepis.1